MGAVEVLESLAELPFDGVLGWSVLDVGLVVGCEEESVVDWSVLDGAVVDCDGESVVDFSVVGFSVVDGGTVTWDGDSVVDFSAIDDGGAITFDGEPVVTELPTTGSGVGVGVEATSDLAVVGAAAAWIAETVFMALLASYDQTIPTGQSSPAVSASSLASWA